MFLGTLTQTNEKETGKFNVSTLVQTLTKAVKALEEKGIEVLGVDFNIRIADNNGEPKSSLDSTYNDCVM